jgi:hypothetical protein
MARSGRRGPRCPGEAADVGYRLSDRQGNPLTERIGVTEGHAGVDPASISTRRVRPVKRIASSSSTSPVAARPAALIATARLACRSCTSSLALGNGNAAAGSRSPAASQLRS